MRTFTDNTDLSYGYDPFGRLTSVTVNMQNGTALPAPEVTTYDFDTAGRLNQMLLPNGVDTEFIYNLSTS